MTTDQLKAANKISEALTEQYAKVARIEKVEAVDGFHVSGSYVAIPAHLGRVIHTLVKADAIERLEELKAKLEAL